MDKAAPANVNSMVTAQQSCNRLLRRRCALDDTCHVYPVQAFYLGGGNDVATKARAETMHGQLSVLEAEGLIRNAEPVANGVLLQIYAELFLQLPSQACSRVSPGSGLPPGIKYLSLPLDLTHKTLPSLSCSQATLCNCFMGFLVYN